MKTVCNHLLTIYFLIDRTKTIKDRLDMVLHIQLFKCERFRVVDLYFLILMTTKCLTLFDFLDLKLVVTEDYSVSPSVVCNTRTATFLYSGRYS